MLLEKAVATLASSIAKALVKEWASSDFIGEVFADTIDFFKDSGLEITTRRRALRNVEAIGKQVVREVTVLFEKDRAGIGEPGYRAVAVLVASSLNEAHITSELLISLSLRPTRLYNHLLQVNGNIARSLGDKELSLYRRVLEEISRQVIEIASSFSGFSHSSVAATLDGQERILQGVTRLLTLRDENAKKFESKYCDEVKKKLDRMDLIGVRRVDELHRAQSLTVSYIPLLVEPRLIASDGSRTDDGFPRDQGKSLEKSSNPGWSGTSIEEALLRTRRVVIRGEAGSGKTTLLQWLAVRSAGHDFPARLASWNHSVPFVIRLREHVDSGFPEPEWFPRLIGPMIAGSMPKGWVHEQLETGLGLVLVDGVDELPREQRAEMLNRLSELVQAYPLARYVVTSRPSALKSDNWPEWSDWIAEEEFVEVSIRSMEPEQINDFVDHWHLAVREVLVDTDEREEIGVLAANLKRLLQQRPALRKLATTPLLCAMICALHRERRQRLPTERIRLYEECCEMLLTGRDDVRRITLLSDYPDLGETQKWALAQSFAYWLMQNGWTDIEIDRADDHFCTRLELMSLPEKTSGSQVRTFFVERTSLLREPVHGRIDFRHRTFQEFLGAQAAVREGDIGVLVKNASDDLWRELIILAAGLAGPKECERLLNGLLKRAATLKRRRKQVTLLALACLETAVEVRPSTREAVLAAASEFFPPSRVDEAPLFAAAGDPAIPLLMPSADHTEQVSAACVRTLAAIGSHAALHAVAQYGSDTRWHVQGEIGRAWNHFDRHEFAESVLINTNFVSLERFTSWDGFEHLSHISGLYISEEFPFNELVERSREFPNLTSLRLFGVTKTDDLSKITAFPNLIYLGLWGRGSGSVDLRSIQQLNQLEHLVLGEFEPLVSLDELMHNDTLQVLGIHWCRNIQSIEPLSTLRELTSLELSGFDARIDLSPLTGLTAITHLELQNVQLSNVEALGTLPNLHQLVIEACDGVHDVGFLCDVENLRYLEINEMHAKGIRSLNRLVKLIRDRGGEVLFHR